MHVTIIGGGIAGLSAAWFLEKQDADISYSLLEASPRLGGKIQSDHQDGFLLEGGADSFVTQKPAALSICRELGLTDEMIPCNSAESTVYILRNGKLIPLPAGFRLAAPTQLWSFARSPIMSLPGKLRVGLEPFIKAGNPKGDESLASFIQRRLGGEILERIAGPMMSGIFSTDPERLSMACCFPRFQQLEREHGSVIRGMLAEKKKHQARAKSNGKTTGKPPAMFMGLRSGMQTLIDGMVDRLTGDLHTNSQVLDICRQRDRYIVRYMQNGFVETMQKTDAVILATPANISGPMVRELQPTLADELDEMRYSHTIHAYLGYRAADLPEGTPPPGFGFVAPPAERSCLRSCTFSSTKFPGRAQDDQVLLRAFLSSEMQETMIGKSDAEILALIRGDLKNILGIQAKPILQKVYTYPTCNPQYAVGHLDRMARIDSLSEQIPGLYFTGSSYRGVGVPDCIADAEKIVAQCVAEAIPDEALAAV